MAMPSILSLHRNECGIRVSGTAGMLASSVRRILALLVLSACSLMTWAECEDRIGLSKPNGKYTDFNNGIVLDKDTGLEWKKCSSGLTGNVCETGTAINMNWLSALSVANNEVFGGYDDWRLPNKKELASLVEKACFSPAANLNMFPGTQWDVYWTSSPYVAVADNAWVVDFSSGYNQPAPKSSKAYLRLVRAGY